MKNRERWITMLGVCVLIGGCIVGDQLSTITIHPDGSAELILVRSNLRSTEQGDRAESELGAFRRQFADRTEGEIARIHAAGGEILQASWIREEVPMANVVRARLPDASALERYFTVQNEAGEAVVFTQFHRDGVQRRLVIHIGVPADQVATEPTHALDAAQLQQAHADGMAETRIAVSPGTLQAARGFTLAGDKQSALLNVREINDLLRAGRGQAELFLEWQVAP